MRNRDYFAIPPLLLVATGALMGCGADDNLTEAQFTEQANAICVSADAEIADALGPIFGGEPTPDELQVALDAIISTSRQTRDSLAELAPPSAVSDDVDDMIAAFDAANDEAESQGLGFFENDGDPWAPVGLIAAKLGLDACAKG